MSKVRERLAQAPKPLIIAHRGDWSYAPENSLSAIRAALAFDMVEIDVRLASDGVPVVMHDVTVSRTTGVEADVSALTAADVTALTLLESEEHVPSLADALEAGGPDLLFDLDVKIACELDAVADFLVGRPERDRCLLKIDVAEPGDIDALRALERRGGACVFAKHIVGGSESLNLLQKLRSADVAAVEIWFPDIETLRQCARFGPLLTTYTLNEMHCAGLSDSGAMTNPSGVWGPLMGAGVGGIMTDCPGRLSEFCR